MHRLIPINSDTDIPEIYRNGAIGRLLSFHNLDQPLEVFTTAQMLIAMCMDVRKHLNIPPNFAFIMRNGGADIRKDQFKVSFAIAVGGVKEMAIIGHDQCGMCNLPSKKAAFVQGLVENAGWKEADAEKHFNESYEASEVGDEVKFVLQETKNLRKLYPKITIAPFLYKLEDHKLYLIAE